MNNVSQAGPEPVRATPTQAAYPVGQKLQCDQCGAEIEILKPCPCQPPEQVFQCCGRDMAPAR